LSHWLTASGTNLVNGVLITDGAGNRAYTNSLNVNNVTASGTISGNGSIVVSNAASLVTVIISTTTSNLTEQLVWNGTTNTITLKTNGGFAAGYAGNKASGAYSTALGGITTASGAYSTALGNGTAASGAYSTALGNGTAASGDYSTALGNNVTASGIYSTAFGSSTTASGNFSTALGYTTVASGASSIASGLLSRATNNQSFVWSAGWDGTQSVTNFSSNSNQFSVFAPGGFVVGYGTITCPGVSLSSGTYTSTNGSGITTNVTIIGGPTLYITNGLIIRCE